jgi:hypothetical protein
MFGFLDVRTLFRFAFSTKKFSSIVTHQHVVRSALISGGHAKTRISDVIDFALEMKTIFLPSPIRLLKVANGKTCEPGRGMKEHICKEKISRFWRPYGVFFCWDCMRKATQKINKSHAMLKEPRVAQIEAVDSYVFCQPFYDSTGERAGPLVTMSEFEKNTHLENFLQADEQWPKDLKDKIRICLQKSKEDRRRIEEEKIQAKRQRKNEKAARVQALVERLSEALADFPHKEILCRFHENTDTGRTSKGPEIRFVCPFVDEKMREFVLAPSKATKKKLRDVANSIRETADLLLSL